MNPFLRYLADKNSAHRHTDRHTPMTTRPCGLRRAGKNQPVILISNIPVKSTGHVHANNFQRHLNFNPKLLAEWNKLAYFRLIFDLQLVVFNFVPAFNEGLSEKYFSVNST